MVLHPCRPLLINPVCFIQVNWTVVVHSYIHFLWKKILWSDIYHSMFRIWMSIFCWCWVFYVCFFIVCELPNVFHFLLVFFFTSGFIFYFMKTEFQLSIYFFKFDHFVLIPAKRCLVLKVTHGFVWIPNTEMFISKRTNFSFDYINSW